MCHRVVFELIKSNKDLLQGVGAIATSLALIVSLIFGLRNLYFTNRNMGLTHDASIFVSNLKFSSSPKGESIIEVIIENSGKTKATNVDFAFKVVNLDDNDPKNNKFGQWNNSSGLVAYPGQKSGLPLEIPGDYTNHKFLFCYIAYKAIVGGNQEYVDYLKIVGNQAFRVSVNQKSVEKFKPYFDKWVTLAREKIAEDYSK